MGHRSRWWWLAGAIALLALAASFNGLWNGFTYDDRHIVLANQYIKPLRRAWTLFVLPYWPIELGGDGYRPLTLTAFAIQWAMGSGSEILFHTVSIVGYAATCIAAFWLASLLLPTPYAWLAAALFAVHPVHVEAVANVVGQAEIWAGLLLIVATGAYIQGRRRGTLTSRRKLAIALMYLAACLFKEHAIVLPALLIVSEALLVDATDSPAVRLRRHRPFFLALLLIGIFYVYFRSAVIGRDLGGFSMYPAFVTLHVGTGRRILTMLGVVPHWVRLLLWPASLSAEYGPPAYPIAEGLAVWQLPGALILVGVCGLAVVVRRSIPVFSFGIAWLVLTLLPSSNFILPTGILLSERTLFMPSLGAMLALGALAPAVTPHLLTSATRIAVLVGCGTLLGAGIEKSIIQSAAWRDNNALFVASVAAEPMVYRGYYMLGALLMERRERAKGEMAYFKAMALFPHDPFVFYNLAQEYFKAGLYQRAYQMYLRTYQIMPDFQDVRARMSIALAAQGKFNEARSRALEAIKAGSGDFAMLHAIIIAANLDERGRKRSQARAATAWTNVIPR